MRHHHQARRAVFRSDGDRRILGYCEPPRLLVCINKSSFAHAKIVESGCFCVNVLSEMQDVVAKAFAGMLGPNVDRFGVAEWTEIRTGAPALAGAAAAFDCVVAQTLDQFTHTILLGDVVGASCRLGPGLAVVRIPQISAASQSVLRAGIECGRDAALLGETEMKPFRKWRRLVGLYRGENMGKRIVRL